MVEDSLAGVASAKGAGMRAVGVTHTYPAEELNRAGADALVDGLTRLTPDWVARQFPAPPFVNGAGAPSCCGGRHRG